MEKIILTTGGTGGHIFPALAVAEELKARNKNVELLFVGSQYGPEKRLTALRDIEFIGLPVRGFLGRGLLNSAKATGKMCVAICQALKIIRQFQPQAVAGFGGYAAFAPMFAARLLSVPVLLHEQNAIAGLCNRILGHFAQKICLSLPETEGFKPEKCILTGNPIRREMANLSRSEKTASKHLLVLGGSQGAHALNSYIVSILPLLREAGIKILHQTGSADLEQTKTAYLRAGYSSECVKAFIDDMATAYSWADLAFCRSGASTVAELCACELPAILVPFPFAIRDHQTKNALILAKVGAAEIIQEKELEEKHCDRLIIALLTDLQKLQMMSKKASSVARPDAAARVVDALSEIVAGTSCRNNAISEH